MSAIVAGYTRIANMLEFEPKGQFLATACIYQRAIALNQKSAGCWNYLSIVGRATKPDGQQDYLLLLFHDRVNYPVIPEASAPKVPEPPLQLLEGTGVRDDVLQCLPAAVEVGGR